jgi:hypothetical protein
VKERSSGDASVAELSLAAAGGALLVVGFLWGRELARRRTSPSRLRSAYHAPEPAAPLVLSEPQDTGASSIMQAELERLAGVAVSHGGDDPALDVFLAFVGTLDPLPDAATLEPAAQRIGTLRLEDALERPGAPHLGALRLLAAAHGATEGDRPEPARGVGTVTVGRPVETGRRLPDLFEALLHAVRAALSLFA